jgi:O-antigen/teichoic acid export membrane protein
MQNKLSEAFAAGNSNQGKALTSTTYVILTIISFILCITFFSINPYLSWSNILNTDMSLEKELSIVTSIVFGLFFIRLILKNIEAILYADQRPAISNSLNPISNFLILIIVYIITMSTSSSLINLALVVSIVPVIVYSFFSFYFFNKNYLPISPSIKHFQKNYAKNLLNLGIKFFLIQISILILFQTSNILISHLFSPAEVTPYNIVYRYFSTLYMLFNIIIGPFWPAFADAWVREDTIWIKKSIRKLLYIWIGILVFGILMMIISNWFYDIWVGDKVIINSKLSFFMLLYFLLLTFGGVYNMFINGTGKISVQLISVIISAIIFIPLTFLFVKGFNMGTEGVVIAIIISNFYHPFIAPIQYYKIINQRAIGLWNK